MLSGEAWREQEDLSRSLWLRAGIINNLCLPLCQDGSVRASKSSTNHPESSSCSQRTVSRKSSLGMTTPIGASFKRLASSLPVDRKSNRGISPFRVRDILSSLGWDPASRRRLLSYP